MAPVISNFTRTLGSSLGDAVNVCVSQGSAGIAYGVQLSVVEDGVSRDRVYRAEVKTSGNPEGWRRLVSLDRTESGTTWALDVLVDGVSATFRLVRSGSSAGSTVLKCKVLAYSGAGGSVTITGSATTFQDVTNVGTYEGALLTRVDGKVGIGTDVPGETLDVVGSLRVSGNTMLEGLSENTTGNAVYIDAATGLLTYGAAGAGGVDLGNVYTRTELDGGQLDSRYYTETEVNSLLDAKANVANASFTSTTTTDQLSANTLTVLGNVALTSLASQQTGNALYIDAATGQLSYGEIVSDGIDAGNVYTRTQLDAGQLDSRYYTEAEVNSLLGSKENVITASTTATYFRGDKTFQTLNTSAVVESASNLYFTEARAQSALVSQLNAKANVANTILTGNTVTDNLTANTLTVSGNVDFLGLLYVDMTAQGNVIFDTKADTANVYTITQLDGGQLDSRYYTETEVNALLAAKANVANAAISGTLSVSGNSSFGNLSTNVIAATAVSAGNVTTSGSLTASSLTLNNTAWASYVVHSTSTPFTYTGPGSSLANGVPFFAQTEANGTAFVTPSGNNNSVFTFATSGVYLLQSEVDAGFPYFPEADLYTYYIKNGNTAVQFAKETHSPTSFSCTRPYLFTASASDNVRFIMESFAGNEYEVGLNSTRFTMLKLA